ncbi:MAG TPA: PEGA domain-containing protein [Kofleriaceae bacterium]|nr:PEGA domain-containing protein [Kofleriaceae bacterium]
MLARRIIALSPDKAFGKQLATALKAAGGAVDLHASMDSLGKGELQAALVVLHLDGELQTAAAEILPRLIGDTRVICVLPRTNLAAVVDIMQSSDRVSGLLVAEDFNSQQLSAMATRVLVGDIFGLEKLIKWGTLVHSQLVGDYQEKSLCISQISEFAELMGVRRKYREAVEQCVDEMLMNALYDAPVDEQGKQIFSEIPTKTRISLRVEQKVVVQYACDGHQFVVSVRDAFGTLERSTVLKYLYKCLHAPADQQIDRKAGGAGLGLYLMANSASTVMFNVLPGVATEAVCVFDLETPKIQLEEIGFFTEKIDAGGRLAVGASRRLPSAGHPVERRRPPDGPAPSRGLIGALAAAIVLVLALVGLAAWQRMGGAGKQMTNVTFTTVPKGATIEIEGRNEGTATDGTLVRSLEVGRAYPVVAKLEGYEPKTAVVQPRAGDTAVSFELAARQATVLLDTLPSGATVEIDGKPIGTTPVTVTTLPPGSTQQVVFKKAGYRDQTTSVNVPSPGKELNMVLPMQVSEDLARIKIESDPPGAQVVQNGQVLAGVTTPAEVLVEAGKPQRFTLTMPDHVPAVIDAFTPGRGATGITKSAKLVAGAKLTVEANLDGKITVTPAPHCKDMTPPVECVLGPGSYAVDFVTQGGRATHSIAVKGKPMTDKFELGYVDAGEGKMLQVAGQKVKRAVLEVGPRSVTVLDEAGSHQVQVRVKAGTPVVAN